MISEEIPPRLARAERRQSRRRSRVFQETTRIESSIADIANPILPAKLRPRRQERSSAGVPRIVTRVRGRTRVGAAVDPAGAPRRADSCAMSLRFATLREVFHPAPPPDPPWHRAGL